VHPVQFQALGRDLYNKDGFHPTTEATTAPNSFQAHGMLDANELGWKNTVSVNPGEMVSIAATFDGFTGCYIYYCHMLEYEDHDMMRPMYCHVRRSPCVHGHAR
jgi:spore coat protein A